MPQNSKSSRRTGKKSVTKTAAKTAKKSRRMGGKKSARTAERQRLDGRRRLEQMLKNPACEANVMSAAMHVPMAEVAKAEGIAPSIGESVFAIQRGQQFESKLLENDAAELCRGLIDAGVLPANAAIKFVDLRVGSTAQVQSLDDAIEATRHLLLDTAAGTTDAIVVAAAALAIDVAGIGEVVLIIDALIVDGTRETPRLTIAEIKTYPDCGGYTDATSLAGMRLQAGLYWHALALAVADLGIAASIDVNRHGAFVLTKPGGNRPSIRANEDLTFMAQRAARGLSLLSAHASKITSPPADSTAAIAQIQAAQTQFCEACLGFCDRVPTCHARAFADEKGAVLGDDVQRLLGDIPLARAVKLMAGAKPTSDAEKRLAITLAKHVFLLGPQSASSAQLPHSSNSSKPTQPAEASA